MKTSIDQIDSADVLYSLVYCRVSSKRQLVDGNGLLSQESRCKDLSDRSGYIYEKTFRDEGISGGLLDRPAMKRMLKYIDDHPGKKFVVIFDDLSRWARDVQVHFELRKTFASRGVILKCLNFKLEDTEEGKFIETIIAGKNELDRAQNRRQVCQKMRARMEDGYWPLCQPTGMYFKKVTGRGKMLFYYPEMSAVLREAIEGYASQKFPLQSDVQEFLQSHIDAFPSKKEIHPEFVKRILTEILYTGYLEYKPWKVERRKAEHEGFVSIETFDKVQELLKANGKALNRSTDKTEFPLRRVVSCGICGLKMTGSRVRGKLKPYEMYTCNNKSCSASPKNIQKEKLETAYSSLLGDIQFGEETVELMRAISEDKWQELTQDAVLAGKNREKKLRSIKADIANYVDLAGSTKSPVMRMEYEKKVEKLGKELQNLKASVGKEPQLDFESAWKEVEEFLRTPSIFWEESDVEGKYMVHSLIFIENPRFDLQRGFGTPKVALPFAVKPRLAEKTGGLVEMAGIEPASKKEVRNRLLS